MSLRTRKIILWSIMIVLGACLLFWWVNNFQEKITSFQGGRFIEGLNFPKIEIPQMPKISEDGLEELKEVTNENGQ